MTTEQIRQRSDILNTQVVTIDTAKRLGVVKELLVDIDRREVVALGLRDNLLAISGLPKYMLLSSIRRIGDTILVDDEDVIEDVDVEAYSSLINSEVITETGELLGRVRSFKFNIEDAKVSSLIIASLGLPQIPDQVISTYELPIDEIVSSGPNRLIVFEGAEERLTQLTVGVLERLGVGRPPWEREAEESGYYPSPVRAENQLGTGIPVRTPVAQPLQTPIAVEETWDEDDWREEAPREPMRRQAPTPTYYEEEEEDDNWSDERDEAPRLNRYEQPPYEAPAKSYGKAYVDEYEDDVEGDAWDDDVESQPYKAPIAKEEPQPYKAPKLNIPEKTKTPEYEEESGY